LFWDCDFATLDWQQHRDFIVRRVLASGTWDAVCWLRTRLGDPALAGWIGQHEGRSLSSQQLRFWELILDLPAELVNAWLQSDERRIWEGRAGR
jgi:hypothetical protein